MDKLAAIATLGTRRAPMPREIPWPDPSLTPVETQSASPETRLLRAAAAGALFEGAGARAAPEATSGAAVDFPEAGAPLLAEPAAWRLARIVSGEHPYLLSEWFELAGLTGRVLPPHWLPMVLEHVAPAARAGCGAVLGPAARWLSARQGAWTAAAPVAEFSDLAWQEGSISERLAALSALRAHSSERARAWLRATWEMDPPDAREAFLRALIPTVEPGDEELLEMALDDKRKAVRQVAAEALARLPASAHAQRIRDRVDPLLSLAEQSGGLLARLRKRKLAVELPAALDKAAQRDGIELKVPAARKIGERAYWLAQLVSFVTPRHWCQRFSCDAEAFLDAVLATDFKNELLDALTEAAARHPEREWTTLLARAWLASARDFMQVSEALQSLAGSATPADRAALIEMLIVECKPDQFGVTAHMLESLDFAWSATLTRAAFDRLERVVADDTTNYPQNRNALDAWARHCDVAEGARRGAALAARCGESHRWRNALEQFNEIVAFRAAMQEELRP